MQLQKISILPPWKGLDFPGGVGGSLRPNNLKKCMKFIVTGISRGVGGRGSYRYFLELQEHHQPCAVLSLLLNFSNIYVAYIYFIYVWHIYMYVLLTNRVKGLQSCKLRTELSPLNNGPSTK